MGLGKTLSLLALVCSHLDALDGRAIEADEPLHDSRTTLIIAPKSSKTTRSVQYVHLYFDLTIPALIGWIDQVKR